jgi:NADH-quinone oxidoreductase subunit H
MVLWQANHYWGFIAQPLGFILYATAAIAETKRIPFDVPEGESEIVGGYFTEYSGMKFGMFFMGEFIEVVLLAALATTIFFGGWDVPFLYRSGFHIDYFGWHTQMPHAAVIGIQVLAFLLKVTALIWLQLQVRWTLPRFRYDQIMSLCWKYLLPLALVNILVTGVLVLLFPGLFGG